MQRGIRTFATSRGPNPLAGCFFTLLWVLGAMAALSVGSFFLARDYFAMKILEPSKVQSDRPHPVRVLSPEEAAAVARDEDSHVWTKGVSKDDIPKLPPQERSGERRRSRHRKTEQTVKPDASTSRGTTTTTNTGGGTAPTPPAPSPPPANTGGTPTVDD